VSIWFVVLGSAQLCLSNYQIIIWHIYKRIV